MWGHATWVRIVSLWLTIAVAAFVAAVVTAWHRNR